MLIEDMKSFLASGFGNDPKEDFFHYFLYVEIMDRNTLRPFNDKPFFDFDASDVAMCIYYADIMTSLPEMMRSMSADAREKSYLSKSIWQVLFDPQGNVKECVLVERRIFGLVDPPLSDQAQPSEHAYILLERSVYDRLMQLANEKNSNQTSDQIVDGSVPNAFDLHRSE